MPRNASGTYSLPNPPVVTGTTIDSADENDTRDDIASELTNSLDRAGRGAMTAALKVVDGTAASPGVQFSSDANNGMFRNGADDWSFSAGSIEVANLTTTGFKVFGFKLNTLSPAQITANQDDYNPTNLSTASYLRLDTDAARELTGLQGGVAGRTIRIHYIGSTTLTLKDESSSSTAAYRFALPADLVLRPDMSVDLTYDATTSRWRMVTGAVSSAMTTVTMAASINAGLGALITGATEDTAPDKIADFLGSYDASATTGKKLRLITALARAMPFGQGLLINGKISTSVASNALTVAVKTDAGSDPSPTDPAYALFRKSTLTDSGFDVVAITGALSMVVSSGSSLGHRSGAACTAFGYLINNAGTAELAVSSMAPDHATIFGDTRLISTTAEGGAGAADSATVVYSTTARSNVPWICVAMIFTTQATAGTWASAMTQVSQAPFSIPKYGFRVYRSSNQLAVATATWTKFTSNTEDFDLGGAYDLATDNRYECVVGGLHTFHFQTRAENPVAGMQNYAGIYVNGVQYSSAGVVFDGTTGGQSVRTEHEIYLNTGDYVEAYLYHSRGTTEDFTGGSLLSFFDGVRH